MIRFSVAGVAVLCLLGCGQEWTGYAYPDRNDLTEYRRVGTFQSLEECRAESLNLLRELVRSPEQRGDFECGLNCRYRNGLNVCDRTER